MDKRIEPAWEKIEKQKIEDFKRKVGDLTFPEDRLDIRLNEHAPRCHSMDEYYNKLAKSAESLFFF